MKDSKQKRKKKLAKQWKPFKIHVSRKLKTKEPSGFSENIKETPRDSEKNHGRQHVSVRQEVLKFLSSSNYFKEDSRTPCF